MELIAWGRNHSYNVFLRLYYLLQYASSNPHGFPSQKQLLRFGKKEGEVLGGVKDTDTKVSIPAI